MNILRKLFGERQRCGLEIPSGGGKFIGGNPTCIRKFNHLGKHRDAWGRRWW